MFPGSQNNSGWCSILYKDLPNCDEKFDTNKEGYFFYCSSTLQFTYK